MKKYDLIRRVVMALYRIDQDLRELAMESDLVSLDGLDEFTSATLLGLLRDCDCSWPTVKIVGPKAAHAAVLIARHCDHNVTRQQLFASMMRTVRGALRPGVDPADAAFLMDRICVNLNMPQPYGTQMMTVRTGRSRHAYVFRVRQLQDTVAEVNARRKLVGLPTIDRQIADMYKKYGRKRKKRRMPCT